MLDLNAIDQNWTLFLDRDGVINYEKENDYIYHWDEFVFYEGVKEALGKFSKLFKYIIIVTNQRGIEKGLMTEADLHDIHMRMKEELAGVDAHIDGIYFCSSLDNGHPNRKPQPGMAYLAAQDFPGIDFSRSIMVGNNISDMEFGRNAGMHTVFLQTTRPNQEIPHPAIDLAFKSLLNFAEALPQA
ncbi:HAD family hydrolase [Flavihumibacter rivuli]|uniref:D-glycero-alpha-D-manno-heptose-1,7-bisphosphate 7-phosphatase n=1 Tax=Flavihumibacter rivuli TaxID=2838156 RepID=UPI001BDE6D4D|nr:HAD family hydrolase [Flavihumibacter rivuli]ULQ57548.1 HAD family hydrolase [Flavihumibacter rivuli]